MSKSEAGANARVHGMWGALDRDNDGRISRAELSGHYSTTLQVGGSR